MKTESLCKAALGIVCGLSVTLANAQEFSDVVPATAYESYDSYEDVPQAIPAPVTEEMASEVDAEEDLSYAPDSSSDCQPCQKCCPGCGCKKKKEKQAALKKAAAKPYKVVFWNNNFDYLEDPDYNDWHLGENLKRIPIGKRAKLDIGGSYRARFQAENNMTRLGLTGVDDEFLLHQVRLYANLEVNDWLRFYFEGIDAVSNHEDTNPRPIDEDRSDFLNLFADVRLLSTEHGDLTARLGRQELIFGNQRLVSPLPWGNTRRSFEGYSLSWKGENLDSTFFWTRPIQVNATTGNSANQSQEFWGVYNTLQLNENQTADFFFLRLEENSGNTFDVNTFGGRWEGERDGWLWEAWGAGQFGDVGTASQAAWAFTTGLGRKLKKLPWSPTFWTYFDFATGDDDGNGFNQLFPLAHKYLGFQDFFSRRNIQDLNFLLTVKPTKRLKLLAWLHLFYLQNSNDVPFNVNQTPFVSVAGGDRELGQELDLLAQFTLSERSNVTLGYSHFFTGDWYRTNPSPPPFTGDADFYYLQYVRTF